MVPWAERMTKNEVTGINRHQSAINQSGMPFIRLKYVDASGVLRYRREARTQERDINPRLSEADPRFRRATTASRVAGREAGRVNLHDHLAGQNIRKESGSTRGPHARIQLRP